MTTTTVGAWWSHGIRSRSHGARGEHPRPSFLVVSYTSNGNDVEVEVSESNHPSVMTSWDSFCSEMIDNLIGAFPDFSAVRICYEAENDLIRNYDQDS